MNDSLKVVLYSHDSQGIGHVRRNLSIAHQLSAKAHVSGLMVSGLADAQVFPLPAGFDWLFIPAIKKGAGGYLARNLAESTDNILKIRSRILSATLKSFAPDLVIVDRHIFGVGGELRKPLRQLKKKHPHARIVLGLREILDEPAAAKREWAALGAEDEIAQLVDDVWVYGSEDVHDPVATGEIPAFLADKVRYTGYLAHGRESSEPVQCRTVDKPFILTTVGGGSDGFHLVHKAARMKVPSGYQHIVVAGPQMHDSDFFKLRQSAHPDTQIYRSWPGLSKLIASASAVISMGGYNTACEILASRTPALIVPREVPRKEQLIRAQALRAVGAAEYLRPHAVSESALAEWVKANVDIPVDRSGLALNGLEKMAEFATDLTAMAGVK